MAARSSVLVRAKKEIASEVKKTPPEYLPALLQIVRVFRQSLTLQPADESFRTGMREALSGDVRPIDDLWDGIVEDE
jgi:hypothetical protein